MLWLLRSMEFHGCHRFHLTHGLAIHAGQRINGLHEIHRSMDSMEEPEPLSVHGGLGRRRATITTTHTDLARGSRPCNFVVFCNWIDMFGALKEASMRVRAQVWINVHTK